MFNNVRAYLADMIPCLLFVKVENHFLSLESLKAFIKHLKLQNIFNLTVTFVNAKALICFTYFQF